MSFNFLVNYFLILEQVICSKHFHLQIGIIFYHLSAFIIINTILSNVFTGLISNGFDDYYEKYEQKQDDIENKAIYICNLSKNKTDLIVY